MGEFSIKMKNHMRSDWGMTLCGRNGWRWFWCTWEQSRIPKIDNAPTKRDLQNMLANNETKMKTEQHAADKAKARRKSVMGGAWPRAAFGGRELNRQRALRGLPLINLPDGSCPQCTIRDGRHETGCPIEYFQRMRLMK
jgi:hypothetical protein